MKWSDCAEAFYCDGSWRDIYVLETSEADWERFLAFLAKSELAFEFSSFGEPAALPITSESAFPDREIPHYLRIDAGGVSLNCHFFWPGEIELDLDPSEVASQSSLDPVMEFMTALGSALSRDVILTAESDSKAVLFRYSASDGRLRFEME